jgi:hypothetical protein
VCEIEGTGNIYFESKLVLLHHRAGHAIENEFSRRGGLLSISPSSSSSCCQRSVIAYLIPELKPVDNMKTIPSSVVTALIFSFAFSTVTSSAAPLTVPGTADPWLAGMTNGSTASGGDVAPAQSPTLVSNLLVIPGNAISFRVSGGVHFVPGDISPPDGLLNSTGAHGAHAENGISDVQAPWDALLGVFLGPEQPNLSSAPATLDFWPSASRDYFSVSPLLKQVFFIGDGLTSTGVRQQVIVPPGATRLFLGPLDGSGWFNNIGSFSVDVLTLVITNTTRVSDGIAISGNGGTSNGLFLVLSSVDVTLPLTNWPAISTNSFDEAGNFNFTNSISPSQPHQFFFLLQP